MRHVVAAGGALIGGAIGILVGLLVSEAAQV